MKPGITYKLLIVFMGLLTASCEFIEEKKATEIAVGTPTSEPADFTVQPGQNSSGQSSSQNDTGSTGSGSSSTSSAPPSDGSVITQVIRPGLVINGGAARTASSQVSVEFIFIDDQVSMKYGFTADCSDGTWGGYEAQKTLTLPNLNASNTVSVRYRDFDGHETVCFSKSIIHDNAGPVILFQVFPSASIEEGSTANLGFNVTDVGSKVYSVSCKMNDIVKPCLLGDNVAQITAMPVGSYTFSVQAEDELGNKSSQSVSWNVVSSTRLMSQEFDVNDYRKVDVLFVIDNSGSMAYEQQSMAKRTSNFLSLLQDLDWQIGITTTDPNNIALGDGRLIPITGGAKNQYIIDSRQAAATAQSQLSNTLQRKETGSGTEQGIRAVYRTIERFNANEKDPRQLIREGSQLAVVLISDEDESANTVKNNPENLVKLVHDSFQGNKRFSYHSIVTRTGDKVCLSTYGATVGARYEAMSRLTGGLIGNVCEMDYAAQVQDIAKEIRNLLKSLTLQCTPVANTSVSVQKDGADYNENFKVNGLNVVFEKELPPGAYTVKYSCLKQ